MALSVSFWRLVSHQHASQRFGERVDVEIAEDRASAFESCPSGCLKLSKEQPQS